MKTREIDCVSYNEAGANERTHAVLLDKCAGKTSINKGGSAFSPKLRRLLTKRMTDFKAFLLDSGQKCFEESLLVK